MTLHSGRKFCKHSFVIAAPRISMQGKISITGVVIGSALLGKAEIPWVAQTSALSLAKAKPS